MGSEKIKLPIIDFSNLKHETSTWESLKTQVRQALEEYGCFEAIFDKIPLHLQKSVFDELQLLFDLPSEIKLRNRYDKPNHGYIGRHAKAAPLYECFAIRDALSPGKIDSFFDLVWPEGNPSFSKSLKSFCKQLSELDKTVRKLAVESLGLEKYIDEHMNSTNYVIRVQKYNGPQSDQTKLALKSHTDKNIITILYQDEVRGLEVLTKDGEWITVEPSLNSFIVLAGDSFHAWTNGRLHSSHHRVMMTGDKPRYSIGLFTVPKTGYIVTAPEEMVDEDHPLLFKPLDYDGYLNFYYSEPGQASPDAFKEFCGV